MQLWRAYRSQVSFPVLQIKATCSFWNLNINRRKEIMFLSQSWNSSRPNVYLLESFQICYLFYNSNPLKKKFSWYWYDFLSARTGIQALLKSAGASLYRSQSSTQHANHNTSSKDTTLRQGVVTQLLQTLTSLSTQILAEWQLALFCSLKLMRRDCKDQMPSNWPCIFKCI